jgi:electron transport complex protein RnfD
MADMLIMLAAPASVAVYHYGVRSFWIVAASVFASIICESLIELVKQGSALQRTEDLSAVFTGAAIALMLPASAPLWLAPIGSIFAIAVVKLPFGNIRTSPFVPAAAGFAFLTLCYPNLVFTYPSTTMETTLVTGDIEFVSGTSIAHMLTNKMSIGTSILDIMNLFVGKAAGPMGTSSLLVMTGLFFYMIVRRRSDFITTASFLAVCSAMAVIFPRVLSGRSYSLIMELCAGMLFFSAVFFFADPVTSPKDQTGKVLYGFAGGILTMIFRYYGAFEEGVCFVVLIMNAVSSYFDVLAKKINKAIEESGKNKDPKTDKNKKAKRVPDKKGKGEIRF